MELKWTFLLLGLLPVVLTRKTNSCPPGYMTDGNNCEDEDECKNNPCGNDSVCHNTNGSYFCTCQPGFQSSSVNFTAVTGQCLDINECLTSNNCSKNTTCRNTIGSYSCECLPGYQIITGSTNCTDIDDCAIVPPVCGPHGSCNNTPGNFTCTCPLGFRNEGNSSSTPCKDIDECESEEYRCGEHGNCSNSPGSYHCTCKPGYSNYGNNQSKCTELQCDKVNITRKQAVMDNLLNLYKSSCQSLRDPDAYHDSGETLLENLMSLSDDVVSSANMKDKSTLSMFLGAMEDTLHLIGPQLNSPRTIMNNHMSDTCLEVRKDATPPNGTVTMRSEGVHLNISWKTVVGKDYPGFAYVALVSYKNLSHPNISIHKDLDESQDETGDVSYQLNSRVVTALVSNKHTEHLPEPVTLTFEYLQKDAAMQENKDKQVNYNCVYWDESQDGGTWSHKGCVKAEFNSTHAVCSWSHLSSFAVLMALYPVKETFELVLITRIGLTLSLVCLFMCILTFWLCRPIKGTRTTIHLHLCLCLFIADFIFLFFITSTGNKVGCAVTAGLLHYFFLSAFCWMLLEGVQLYRMVVLVFHTTLHPLYLFAAGYGAPLAIVIISAIANPNGYGTDNHCWLSLKDNFIWSFFAPVCIIIMLNSFFFVITVWKLAGKFSSLNPDLSKLRKLRGFVVTAVAQLCVLGGMWVFGCFMFQEEGTVVMLYLFTVLNSLQGVLIFIMHCLMSKAIREEYSKLCGGICRPQKKYSEFSTNQSSNSQKPLRSAPSTGESQI